MENVQSLTQYLFVIKYMNICLQNTVKVAVLQVSLYTLYTIHGNGYYVSTTAFDKGVHTIG